MAAQRRADAVLEAAAAEARRLTQPFAKVLEATIEARAEVWQCVLAARERVQRAGERLAAAIAKGGTLRSPA